MTTKSVKVGIVGLGLASASHFTGYASHPHSEVVAVCDTDEERAQEFGSTHGISPVYTSFDEMLERADLDLVDIATPTYLHATMTRQAAEAGKHVHCEKPFCRSVEEGQDAITAARRSRVKLLVGETYVFLSSHMKARELIEAGEIGRPLQVRQRQGAWLERDEARIYTGPSDRSWRVDPEMSGGGDFPWIFDHTVHFFASAEYFMPGQKIAEVYAVAAHGPPGAQASGAAHDPYTGATIDIPIITWSYEDSSRQGVWMRAERLNGKYDYMNGVSTTIVGETGMIEVLGEGGGNLLWDGQQQHMVLHREGRKTLCFRLDEGEDRVWKSEISYYSQGHVNQVHHLIDCVIQDVEPRYTGEDGLHAVRCSLAAIRSAREGRPVKIEEIDPEYTAYL